MSGIATAIIVEFEPLHKKGAADHQRDQDPRGVASRVVSEMWLVSLSLGCSVLYGFLPLAVDTWRARGP